MGLDFLPNNFWKMGFPRALPGWPAEGPFVPPRIYLLYTGQHYDPIVAGAEADLPVEKEQKRQKKGRTLNND